MKKSKMNIMSRREGGNEEKTIAEAKQGEEISKDLPYGDVEADCPPLVVPWSEIIDAQSKGCQRNV